MSTAATAASPREKLIIAGREFSSRLIIGTGKYRSYEQMRSAHEASGAEMVTVAVRRVPLDRSSESFLDYLSPALQILPNTAGCYTAEDAVRTARLAREALQTDLVKLEVIGDQTTLFPDNEQTLEAARILVKEGFIVLPYFNDDLIMAKKLLDAGCADWIGSWCSESREPAHHARAVAGRNDDCRCGCGNSERCGHRDGARG